MSTPHSRHRVPRRRFHALRLDILLVLFVAGLLVCALPSFRSLRAPAGAAPSFPIVLFSDAPAAPVADDPFNPERIAFGEGGLPDMAELPPPDAVSDALRPLPPPAPPSALGPERPAVGLPVAALRSSLSPAPPLFARPDPAAAPSPAPAPGGTATLFYDAGSPLPTVLVDAPGASPALVRAAEAAALARKPPAASTSVIVRLPLSQLAPLPPAAP